LLLVEQCAAGPVTSRSFRLMGRWRATADVVHRSFYNVPISIILRERKTKWRVTGQSSARLMHLEGS
jgi:hypothetical protein